MVSEKVDLGETQLVEFIDDLANRGQTDVAIMDFSKAFDKVSHQRLLLKLDHSDIRGKTNKWIQAFLANRTQRVFLNGEHLCKTHVKSGVPKGSVLGPCLFLLYINDLLESLGSNDSLFADDCRWFPATATGWHRNSSERLKEIRTLIWEKKWLMAEFNADKCRVLRVTRK